LHILTRLRKALSLPAGLSPLLRTNFIYLFWDIAWWGFYIGSTAAFLAIYAARSGATPGQIGLLAAIPALTSLLLSLPAGRWLRRFPAGKATVWSAFASRSLFLGYVFLPWLFPPELQVEALLILAFLITLPTTIINISFSQFFVEAVPIEWRGMVVGTRIALMSIISFPVTLLCGVILDHLPFPAGYQVVFFIGFLGAILTVPVLRRVHPALPPAPSASEGRIPNGSEGPLPSPSEARLPNSRSGPPLNTTRGSSSICRPPSPISRPPSSVLRLLSPVLRPPSSILRLPPSGLLFLKVVLLLFFFNITNSMIAPLVPDLLVNSLQFSDSLISIATAVSTMLVFLVSIGMARLSHRVGNRRGTALGAILLAFQAVLLALATNAASYMLAVVVGGLASGILASAQYNYHLDALPDTDRPGWLSWSLLLGSAAVLAGSIAGPALAGLSGIPLALVILGGARLLVGVIIWIKG
jgi:MFS family permease